MSIDYGKQGLTVCLPQQLFQQSLPVKCPEETTSIIHTYSNTIGFQKDMINEK